METGIDVVPTGELYALVGLLLDAPERTAYLTQALRALKMELICRLVRRAGVGLIHLNPRSGDDLR